MKLVVLLCAFTAVSLTESRHLGIESRGKICRPGSFFMDDCNRCRCTKDGLDKTCTRINCLRNAPESKDERCTPGKELLDTCDHCVCPTSGLKKDASCSKKLCPRKRERAHPQHE